MENVVRANVVRIGNSRGIRIPKVWLEQLRIGEEVELAVRQDKLIIRRARVAREGWGEAFQQMTEQREDQIIDEPITTKWDEEEWEW